MKKYIKFINIVLLVICMISIFLLSSEDRKTSTNRSIDTTKKVVSVVTNDDSNSSEVNSFAKKYFVKIRKSAHFIEYLCLGILVINVIKDYKKINYKWIIICILFCLLYSVSDEVHQIYVPGRSCELRDIFIDTSGSIIGIIIFSLINFVYRKRYN